MQRCLPEFGVAENAMIFVDVAARQVAIQRERAFVKLTKILLRWYKSFHLNYRGISEKGETTAYRPWNKLSPPYVGGEEFPFIEIPIEADITTIVGANESGKSHLLNAVTKVVRGSGIDDLDKFECTDLCHYAGVRTRNVEAWPNIGLQFSIESKAEFEQINAVVGDAIAGAADTHRSFALVLAPDQDANRPAQLFIEPNDQGIPLDLNQLDDLRKLLPSVQFIDSSAQLTSEIPLARLIAAYDDSSLGNIGLLSRHSIEEAATLMQSLAPPAAQQAVPPDFRQKLEEIQGKLSHIGGEPPRRDSLEMHLFREILGITLETLRYVYNLTVEDRGYTEGLVSKWNDAINDRLNLAHFWSQDEQFSLSVDLKDGIVYFEIRDKTDSIYTFKERSSGLKFFLSYYVQAKAMEMSSRNRNSIILMDEPDSALSILGQRNLLAVLESLVSPESSGQTCQLIYTTHSPYLINRNFPRRIRVVKKEDAEQGTQYIEQARARRYEPVRTALGIDSAPSLFLGADNILTEGPTDQFLLTELIRVFATPANVGDFLDLNTVAVVSADGVGNIENVLDHSRWADEPIPPTVIIVDADKPALEVIQKITKHRKLIDGEFAKTVAELVSPYGGNTSIVTVEDLVPRSIYADAVKAYFQRWLPSTVQDHGKEIEQSLGNASFGKDGLVGATKEVFRKFKPEFDGEFDKMGVLQEVVAIASTRQASTGADPDLQQLRKNIVAVCDFIREALAKSRTATAKYSTTQAIKRIIHDFNRLNKGNVPLTAMQKLFRRLEREVAPIGTDGEPVLRVLNQYVLELDGLRAAGQERIVEPAWTEWKSRIERMKNNPLSFPQPGT